MKTPLKWYEPRGPFETFPPALEAARGLSYASHRVAAVCIDFRRGVLTATLQGRQRGAGEVEVEVVDNRPVPPPE